MCVTDTYDFDVKGFLATHRTITNEVKTMLVKYSNDAISC